MDYFTPIPSPATWQPPIFQVSGAMTPRALSWRTLLYNLVFSVWEAGLPDGWLPTPFRYILFGYGSLAVVYTRELGWIYGFYGVEKIGWQYEPLLFTVTNHVLPRAATGIRGLNGTILHVHDDYTGYDALVNAYAEMLASCDKGVEMNLEQARMGKIIATEDKKDADTIREALNGRKAGDPIVYLNKRLMGEDGRLNVSAILGDLGSEFFADKLMETRLMIIKEFLTRIGVRTVGMEKREHLLNQEIAENNDETGAEPYSVLTSLAPDLEILQKLGVNITLKPRYDYSGAGVEKNEKEKPKEKEGSENEKE